MREPDGRHHGEAQPLGGEDAAMAGDQHAGGIDQHWVHEAELSDRGRDLADLRCRCASARWRRQGIDAMPSAPRPRRCQAAWATPVAARSAAMAS
jgi:hypothetical protein